MTYFSTSYKFGMTIRGSKIALCLMLELKVSRCCKLNDERQLSAILFIGKSCDNDEYIAVVIINDTLSPSYAAVCRYFFVLIIFYLYII
ncbi:unnamed protein product [Onchocerca flexuosa]|uniref:Secreted protein n=1 Tax=Onchocerca flexuosa TaxID=387005 RepID=A0A183HH06_9BILA|nr:unnamed protein product [Onchocerca flexuosa]